MRSGIFPTPRPAHHRTPARRGARLSIATAGLVLPGIFCTVALPAHASDEVTAPAAEQVQRAEADQAAQTLAVSAEATPASLSRAEFDATSPEELRRAAEQRRARVAAASAASASAALPGFGLDRVVAIAMQYQGVPYVYGGASPAGFDCSGFTMYVYAQVGVSLPHGSASQAAGGTRISASAARPGDLVVLDGGSHIGIYLGGGRMIDAPYAGKTVQARAIYTSNHYFVRYGI